MPPCDKFACTLANPLWRPPTVIISLLDSACFKTDNSENRRLIPTKPPSSHRVFYEMEAIQDAMSMELILWLTLLAVIVVVAFYVIGKVRPKPEQQEPTASQWMTEYQELHAKGVLSDEEFRTIKSTLSKQLQNELNTNGKAGSNE